MIMKLKIFLKLNGKLNKIKENKIMTNLEKIKKLEELRKQIYFAQKILSIIEYSSYLRFYENEFSTSNIVAVRKSDFDGLFPIIQKSITELLNKEIEELEKQIEFIFSNKITS